MTQTSRRPRGPVRNVGTLSLPLHTNYGGILQAVALYQFLEAQGFTAVLMERAPKSSRVKRMARDLLARVPGQNVRGIRGQWLWANRHRRFISKHIPRRTGALGSSEEMARAVRDRKLGAVIVGSDQVWRREYGVRGSFHDRFLGFVPDAVRRISYAASFGHEEWTYPEETEAVGGLLARFDSVSVREKSAVAICRDPLGRADAAHVVDPTLLISPDYWRAAAAPAAPLTGKTVMQYILDDSAGVKALCDGIIAALGPDYAAQQAAADGENAHHEVADWIRFFRDADFVITDSFHGTVFSIIFRKNFVAVVNKKRGADRFVSLAGMLGLSDRLVSADAPEEAVRLVGQPIDYRPVGDRIEKLRAESAEFLLSALS